MHLGTFLDLVPSSLPAAIAAALVVISGALLATLTALVVLRLLDSLARYLRRINASRDSSAGRASTDSSEQVPGAQEIGSATGQISESDADARRLGPTVDPQEAVGANRAKRAPASSELAAPVEKASTVSHASIRPANTDSASKGTSVAIPIPLQTAK